MIRTRWNLGGTGTSFSPERTIRITLPGAVARYRQTGRAHKTHVGRMPGEDKAAREAQPERRPPRRKGYFLAYQSALTGVKLFHFSGRSSRAKMAVTGQTGTHAPQSMHSVGLM